MTMDNKTLAQERLSVLGQVVLERFLTEKGFGNKKRVKALTAIQSLRTMWEAGKYHDTRRDFDARNIYKL